MVENLSNVEYASLLYDFYGELLKDSEREVMNLYHEDNLSLTEIAEEIGQSRQGVHYTLKRAEKSLGKYEEKLGLVARYRENRKQADLAEQTVRRLMANSALDEDTRSGIRALADLIRDLTE
ncbi:MAG: DNA-binding protein [Mogibacterium sp.]|nr:DNA-binding protein [Mogibacterium sp.]